jgi:hypothetical protein
VSTLVIDVPEIANVVEIRNCLMSRYDMTRREADEVIRYTVQDTVNQSKEWKVGNGYITLRYHKLSRFSLEDNTSVKKVVKRRQLGYSSIRPNNASARKGITVMPPRKGSRQTAPPPEPEANGETDFAPYLSKDLSATMADYATWFDENVADVAALGKSDPDRLLALGSSLYPHFQKSAFNQERRAERRAARTEPEPEPEPAAPARGRGRGRAPAAAAAPPARGRGRGRAARQPAEAVY